MKQKVITMLTELKPSGVMNIERKDLPTGYRVKQILSATLDTNFSIKDLAKRSRFLVTLLVESNERSEEDKEGSNNDLSFVINPYF